MSKTQFHKVIDGPYRYTAWQGRDGHWHIRIKVSSRQKFDLPVRGDSLLEIVGEARKWMRLTTTALAIWHNDLLAEEPAVIEIAS